MKYTSSQLQAVNTLDKNLHIIACAGSGKTQVISQRIINILRRGINPSAIIAFTYTEKAAGELQARILKLCREELSGIKGLAEMYVGTIHAWCLNILRNHKYELQKFSVLDEIKLKLFVDRNFDRIGMRLLDMERFVDTGHFIQLMGILREADFLNPTQVPPELFVSLGQYEKILNESCYFDFTMIMTKALQCLQHDSLFQNKIKNSLGYLIVDEYQDVNPIQEQIVREIYNLGANVCVVGDDDQTIFQWRGSTIEYIQQFNKRYSDVYSVILNDNFRSSNAIIDVALTCITNNSNRLPKKMICSGFQKYERGDILYNEFLNVEEENKFIIDTIRELRGIQFYDKEEEISRGLDYSDFAILLRKWKKANAIIEQLQHSGIPFIVSGVNNLFQRPEIFASRAIFLFLNGEIDKDVLIDSWKNLSIYINIDKLHKAIKWLKSQKPGPEMYYEQFILQKVFMDFLDFAGIREDIFRNDSSSAVAGYDSEEVFFYNLGMFSQIINDFEIIHFKSKPLQKLNDFLQFLRYSADEYYPEGWLNNTYKTPNAVRIMTIYQAKGLEFPVVFIPGLNKNYLPTSQPTGKQVWHFIDRNLIRDVNRYFPHEEDERRLMYVAITRSKKFLFVSRAPDGRQQGKESIFAKEIRRSPYIFSSIERTYVDRPHLQPKPYLELTNITLNFSLLKAFFDCPYSFKFYTFYGFVNPLGARMGYGSAIHNALMELHRQYLYGTPILREHLPMLLGKHINFPYATEALAISLTTRANEAFDKYYLENVESFPQIEFAEKEIQLDLGGGIIVNGKMDLIMKKNLDGSVERTIVDFKTAAEPQVYNASPDQLRLYALGYKELTGENADFLEIFNVDEYDIRKFELQSEHLHQIEQKIINAADDIRNNHLDDKCNRQDCVCRFKSNKD